MKNFDDLYLTESYLNDFENHVKDVTDCVISDDIESLKDLNEKLKEFIQIKAYEDGHQQRLEDSQSCSSPSINKTNQCICECHKMDKVAIYDVYEGLRLLNKKAKKFN